MAVHNRWLDSFNSRKEAEHVEIEALKQKWFKSVADKNRLDSLENIWYSARIWDGKNASEKIRGYPRLMEYFAFGPPVLAAYQVVSCMEVFNDKGPYSMMEQATGRYGTARDHAKYLGVLEQFDALVKDAKALVESGGSVAEPSPEAPEATVSPTNDADPAVHVSSGEESQRYVVDACLGAMCLVAAVDGRLSGKEIHRIESEMNKHGFAVEAIDFREAIVSTCRRLASTGYRDGAKSLINELLPFRGRPLASLVLELMEGVAEADGNTGNRERQILELFRRNLLAAK